MSSVRSLVKVQRVAASEVHNVFRVELLGLEGGSIKRVMAEVPRQIQVFKEGEVVEVEVSTQPIPWGEGAELYLRGRVFASKRGEEGGTFYLSVGGLQLRLVVEEGALKVGPMDRVYVAFRTKES